MKLEDFFKNKDMFKNFNVKFKTAREIDKEEASEATIDEKFFKYNLESSLMEKLINYIRYEMINEDDDNAIKILEKCDVIKNIYLLWAYEYELTSGGYEEFFNNRLFLKNTKQNEFYITKTRDALNTITENTLSQNLKNAYDKYVDEKLDFDDLDEIFYNAEVRFRTKLFNYVTSNKNSIIEEVEKFKC